MLQDYKIESLSGTAINLELLKLESPRGDASNYRNYAANDVRRRVACNPIGTDVLRKTSNDDQVSLYPFFYYYQYYHQSIIRLKGFS